MIDSLASLIPGVLVALAALTSTDSVRTVRTLPPVEVRRERAVADARRRLPTAAVTELRAGAANRAFETVGELLQETAGARIVSYGGLGAFSTLSLRGAPAGQVSIFLDGVPLTSAAHGVVNLSDLPAGALERAEVYRGMAPLGFGAATPGGAVNLVTASDPRVRALRVAGGSCGTLEGRGTWGAVRGATSVLAHGGAQRSRGDFTFLDDNGTPFNAADDEVVPRLNNAFDAASALVRAAWEPHEHGGVRVRAEHFRKSQGVPGLGAVQALEPRLRFERTLGALDAELAPRDALPGLQLRAHAARERTRFADRTSELGLGYQDTDTHFADRGVSLAAASPRAWTALVLAAGAGARRETAEPAPPTTGLPVPPQTWRDTESAHAGVQLHAPNDVLVLHAARRWDRQHDHVRATVVGGARYAADMGRVLDAPQLGALVRLPRGVEARANWSRAARAPEFIELFGDNALVQGNPRLVPERGETWDAGGRWHGAIAALRLQLDASHFESFTRQLIAYVASSQRTVRATNMTQAAITGDELAARAAYRSLSLSGSVTWLDARNTDPASLYRGKRLPQRPDRQAYARLDARHGRWCCALDVLEIGSDFLDPINFRRVPTRTLVGASLSRSWRAMRCTLEGKNLGDRRAQDVGGYPLPGRSFFASCDVSWGGPGASPTSERN